MFVPQEVERILFTKEEISAQVKRIGAELTRDYKGKEPLFLCVLKGASVFFADLIREVEIPVRIDFLRASSYVGTDSSGTVTLETSTIPDVKDRDVLIVEDIVDTARTLSLLKTEISGRGARSVHTACLLDKPSRRVVKDFKADYTGMEIEDLFVVGYGLDCGQEFRNLPYIGIYKSVS